MKLICVVLAALICCSALAADVDCTVPKTQALCPTDSCNFTPSDQKKCTSSCLGLLADKCNEQDKYCTFSATKCAPKYTQCDQASGKDEATCNNLNGNCKFTEAINAACNPTDKTTNGCKDITKKEDCNKSDNCLYQQTFVSCVNPENQCTNTTDNCNPNFCTKTTATCEPQGVCTKGNDATTCGDQKGCAWDDTKKVCNVADACATSDKCDTDVCTFTDVQCKASDACAAFTAEDKCTEAGCAGTYKDQTCAVKDTVCVTDKCNTTLCEEVKAEPSKCSNATCGGDPTNCGDACQGAELACQPIPGPKCDQDAATTKDACSKVGFCTFTQYGTCAAKGSDDTSAIALAFSGLIALFAMI